MICVGCNQEYVDGECGGPDMGICVERAIADDFLAGWLSVDAPEFDSEAGQQRLYRFVHAQAPEYGVDAMEDEVEVPVIGEIILQLWADEEAEDGS